MVGRCVRVFWRDAGGKDDWTDPADQEEWAGTPIRPGLTYAILLSYDEDHLTCYGSDHGLRAHSFKIPMESVRQIVCWTDEPPKPKK
jgi:hypothetical protein